MNLDPPEGERSFEAEVCHLLAVITDLLLEPRPDWDTLDRLQYALDPFTPYPPEPPAADVDRFEPPASTGITKEAVEEIYRKRLGEQLKKPPAVFRYTDKPQTTNGAQWTEYAFTKYAEPPKGPGKA